MNTGKHAIRVFYRPHAYLARWSVFVDGWFWGLSEWPEKLDEKRMDMGEVSELDFVKICRFNEETEKPLECVPKTVLLQIKEMAPDLELPQPKSSSETEALGLPPRKLQVEGRKKRTKGMKEGLETKTTGLEGVW